jgi:hypothetical protein
MKLDAGQYNEILTVALDHRLANLKGKTFFDDNDFAVKEDEILRRSLQKHFSRKDVYALKRMLIHLIQSYFKFQDDYDFALYLSQKTGYQIKPIPKEQISISNRRRIYVSVAGTGERALTNVQVLLPTISGCIYCIRGGYPNINAVWLDDHTIEIKVPAIAEEIERVNKVKYDGEIINILYKELKSLPIQWGVTWACL